MKLTFPTSHTASKHSIHTGAGVIDADYRGVVFVLLFNLGDQDFEGMSISDFDGYSVLLISISLSATVKEGDRIAQLILERIYTPDVEEVQVSPQLHRCRCNYMTSSAQELDSTIRGAGGFGSTGGFGLPVVLPETTTANSEQGATGLGAMMGSIQA